MAFSVDPIAIVRGGRSEAIDDDWGASRARITLVDGVPHESLLGLDAFSHAEIIFVFDRVSEEAIVRGARHPRGRKDWPLVGIFAQRGKDRPNRLGLCICRIVHVGEGFLDVEGLDALDGSPVLDIKPVFSGFLPRGDIREPQWANEIMKQYW